MYTQTNVGSLCCVGSGSNVAVPLELTQQPVGVGTVGRATDCLQCYLLSLVSYVRIVREFYDYLSMVVEQSIFVGYFADPVARQGVTCKRIGFLAVWFLNHQYHNLFCVPQPLIYIIRSTLGMYTGKTRCWQIQDKTQPINVFFILKSCHYRFLPHSYQFITVSSLSKHSTTCNLSY